MCITCFYTYNIFISHKIYYVFNHVGLHKWGYPNSWMVYNLKIENIMDDFGVGIPFNDTYIPHKPHSYWSYVHQLCDSELCPSP
jgi:hypothetical protein